MNATRSLLVSLAAGGLLVGAAATAGLLTAGNASAAGPTTGSPAASAPTPSPSGPAAPGQGGQGGQRGPGGHGPWVGRFGGPGALGGLGGLRGLAQGPLLHGELVTGGQNGAATRTVVVQAGKVTAKAGSTITVTSTDGYKVVWTLGDATKVRTGWTQGAVKDITQGDTVLVEGTRSGSTTTASIVAERPAGGPKGGPGGGPATPSPSGA